MMTNLVGIERIVDLYLQSISLMPLVSILLTHSTQEVQEQVIARAHVDHSEHDYGTSTYLASVHSFSPRACAPTFCAKSTNCSSRCSPSIFCSYVTVMSRPAAITSSLAGAQSKRTLEIVRASSIHNRLVHKSSEEFVLCGDERDFAEAVVFAQSKDGFG